MSNRVVEKGGTNEAPAEAHGQERCFLGEIADSCAEAITITVQADQ